MATSLIKGRSCRYDPGLQQWSKKQPAIGPGSGKRGRQTQSARRGQELGSASCRDEPGLRLRPRKTAGDRSGIRKNGARQTRSARRGQEPESTSCRYDPGLRPRPRKNGQRSARDPEEQRAANAKRPPWSGSRQRKLQGRARLAAAAKKNSRRSARDPEEQRAANAKRPPWSGSRQRKLQG
ncbi:hypothetical protein [Bacillus paralicheniformis]|nr:hypothetical protein [Bacillus paralicheniformis]MEC1085041.1 hypothetical protein [Bacillus paralicheniformis]MEC1108841.1 hypothetical protein [Bacillus paralicheniformis]MEC1148064.1 hypothetical protein [Bacillus paralicheniformis]MEC1150237.1 hypothetical protein [Bacillus paralicheniformis]MEC1175521.1 hypothetical protein [Bacillus paralicheniformis]